MFAIENRLRMLGVHGASIIRSFIFTNQVMILRFCIVCLLSVFTLIHASERFIDSFYCKPHSVMQQHIPGFSMVFVKRTQPPRYFNMGVTEKGGNKVDELTLFRLASVSKTFTGSLTAKLVEKGQLDWQQPIHELAPEFQFSRANRIITLQHLLSHSSGLMRNAYET